MQCYDSATQGALRTAYYGATPGESLALELKRYKAAVNPEVYLYSVDLAGYGTSQFPQDEGRVCQVAGWSERLLNFIPLYESAGTDGVAAIEAVSLDALDAARKARLARPVRPDPTEA